MTIIMHITTTYCYYDYHHEHYYHFLLLLHHYAHYYHLLFILLSLCTLLQFIFVITTQYQMLITNQSVAYGLCNVAKEEISQEVSVTSGNEIYKLVYSLSVTSQKLGIESASVAFSEPQVSA